MMEKVKRPGKKLNRQGQGRDALREPRGISGSLNNGKLDERGAFSLRKFCNCWLVRGTTLFC